MGDGLGLDICFPAYLLALALAELPFAIGAVLLSSEFLGRRYWMVAVIGMAGIAFLAWAIGRLHRELEEKPPITPPSLLYRLRAFCLTGFRG